MSTSWNASKICEEFEAYRDFPEQLLGYRFVFKEIQLNGENCQRVLDYGCGPGKVALRFAQLTNKRVVAVDISQEMLSIAAKERSHPLIEYHLIDNDKLDFINDNFLDGAMACYVFLNLNSEARIANIAKEIYRVIKPGAPFIVLDTNPGTTGVEFSTFRSGESNRQYQYGEPIEVVLHIPGKADLVLLDYYWSKSMYQKVLRKAGFSQVEFFEYTLADISESERRVFEETYGFSDWRGEWQFPPCLLVRAIK